jgi:glycosyltransferase involved in cell wall biosynthesis
MLKIGIVGDGFVKWSGGLDFLRTVVSSLHATSVPIEFHFLVPGTGPRAKFKRADMMFRSAAKTLLGRQSAVSHAPSRADLHSAIQSFDVPIELHDIDIGVTALERQARHLSLDVLLPSFYPLPFEGELPWLGYIYDFQHRYLPHLFTERERQQRDSAFGSMLSQAQGIIVNAHEVAADIGRFYPGVNASVFSLPFSTAPSRKWLNLNYNETIDKYGLKNKYFIICNQFWKHKDHATAFDAFYDFIVRFGHQDIDLVCTGSTSDYRSIDYFNSLIEKLKHNQIVERVHILGMIPKNDQIALMRGAIALIQPTLMEGGPGGGAVYDAVAVGTPAIISDIPVNREIEGEELVSLFHTGDSSSLADRMQYSLRSCFKNRKTAETLVDRGMQRRRQCGDVLLNAIDHVRR